MKKYMLTCESTVDIYKEELEELDVPYINYYYYLDDEMFETNISKDYSYEDFYRAIEEGKTPKTTQVNAERFVEFFTPFLESGYDVLHLTFSSGLSGTYNSANLAAKELNEKYQDNKVYVIDSLNGSVGYGLFLREVAQRKNIEEFTLEKLISWIEENKLTVNHWFYTTDISHFIKGGRVGKVEGIIGKRLNICPLMDVSVNGEIIPRYKVIGKKRVFKKAIELMEKHAFGGLNYTGKCYVTHANNLEEAIRLKNEIEERFLYLEEQVKIYPAGAITASHAGPGAVGIFFFGDKRTK